MGRSPDLSGVGSEQSCLDATRKPNDPCSRARLPAVAAAGTAVDKGRPSGELWWLWERQSLHDWLVG